VSELNASQRAIAETIDGMVVVDAGPGTGKTHTIVDRFVNMLGKDGVGPGDILLLTFTRNAAAEMEERIRGKMSGTGLASQSKFIRTGTFDSFCLSIVMESSDSISKFFRMDEKLSRGASMIENETLNRVHFADMLDRFMDERGEDYGNDAVIANQHPREVYNVICRLMSRGILPLRNGWFGGSDGKALVGDPDAVLGALMAKNTDCKLSDDLFKGLANVAYSFPDAERGSPLPEEMLRGAAFEDRSRMLAMMHDVYYEYVRTSVADDRLTFGLVAMFAFAALYSDKGLRERMSFRYLMIDEFQDTNESQLMIALMLLKEPNLCVVGDWKQGIYGFRYADIDNILDFESRVRSLRRMLNDDAVRIPFSIPDVSVLPLDTNYRSSQKVIDASFESLFIPATAAEKIDRGVQEDSINRIFAGRDDISEHTLLERVSSKTNDDEAYEVVRRIVSYVEDPKYVICEGDAKRRPSFGDIAVLCRSGGMCQKIYEAAVECNVPAFLQGDVEIMGTRAGKLALAWLRYVNNSKDAWGIGVILADLGYSLTDIKNMLIDGEPEEVRKERRDLTRKKRRVTDLLTAIFRFYGLNDDVTQTIISVISSSHRGSLMTISDVIGMMEKDMEDRTKYPIDSMLEQKAVIIQTMHKSKGLEYPIVIIAGLDRGVMPYTRGDASVYTFSEAAGMRCRNAVMPLGDFSNVARTWQSYLAKRSSAADYGEERRLMFVAVSRAKQYVMLVSGHRPSAFFTDMPRCVDVAPGSGKPLRSAGGSYRELTERPEVPPYETRRKIKPVHEVMNLDTESSAVGKKDEFCGKGMEYGTKVHEHAYAMAMGIAVKEELPELLEVKKILDSLEGADIFPEIECFLPFNDLGVTLKGAIDLLAVYPDHIVVHDYKTDAETSFLGEYKMQLSIYAHAASGHFKKPARCVIDFVSRNEAVDFDPIDLSVIEDRVKSKIGNP
jgi:superfamily I DNA/RNA helicase